MTSPELENLVQVGSLKRSEASRREIDALVQSGRARLTDASNESLSAESRFDLAYNAAHAIALAALWSRGYRSENRYTVFQTLPHTVSVPNSTWRVLAKAHHQRNVMEYEGGSEIDIRLVADLILAAQAVDKAIDELLR